MEESEGSNEEVQAPAAAADGDSTDAEPNQSDEDLNVHNFIRELEAVLEQQGNNRADLDHMDSMEMLPFLLEDEEGDIEEPEENLQLPGGEESSSDEEVDDAESARPLEAEGPQLAALKRQRLYPPPPAPGAKRLNGKQRPPAEYLAAGIPSPSNTVLKRPAMLKRPATTRGPWPNEACKGHAGAPCEFNPTSPGEAARVHPDRGTQHCIFCKEERMREAHAARRRGTVSHRRVSLFSLPRESVGSCACLRVTTVTHHTTSCCYVAYLPIVPSGQIESQQRCASSMPQIALSSTWPWSACDTSSAKPWPRTIARKQSPRKHGSVICNTGSG